MKCLNSLEINSNHTIPSVHPQHIASLSSSQGMDSGFAGGEDEIYNVYDQPWRSGKDMAQNIYRPSKNVDKDMYGDDLEARIKTNR